MSWFLELNPLVQTLLATLGTWSMGALGASLVIFTTRVPEAWLDASLGLAAGVMMAASFWSLLEPSIAMAAASGYGTWQWVPAVTGFLAGAALLRLADRVLPHLHIDLADAEGVPTTWRRTTLLVMAITLHHIPEGLAVGVAFGAAAAPGLDAVGAAAKVSAAVALAIGIGLQNLPEGTAVAMPLRREGLGRLRAFWWAQLSGAVEPLAGMAGALLVLSVLPLLPYALAFAAGAMIFVIVEELIPEAHRHGNVDLATMSFVIGFALMMWLDVGFG